MVVMDESNLAFSSNETQEWLERNVEIEMMDAIADQFYSLSQGWPMGLELLKSLYLKNSHLNILGDESILTDYIHQEWLHNLGESDITLCRHVAILDCANGAYLNQVFKYESAETILSKLSSQHVYLTKDES